MWTFFWIRSWSKLKKREKVKKKRACSSGSIFSGGYRAGMKKNLGFGREGIFFEKPFGPARELSMPAHL